MWSSRSDCPIKCIPPVSHTVKPDAILEVQDRVQEIGLDQRKLSAYNGNRSKERNRRSPHLYDRMVPCDAAQLDSKREVVP